MRQHSGYGFKTVDKNENGCLPTHKHLGLAYISTTTTHGIPHALVAKGKCKTLFWVLSTVCCLTALTFNLTLLVTKYLQYLPSIKITIHNNRTLPFPAVTICNTNPIKSSTIAKSPRLVALLQSWGVIDSTMNDTRRKRSQDEHNVAIEGKEEHKSFHHIAKRTVEEECIYKQLYDGFRSDCKPSYGFGGLTQEKCFIKVCNELKKGLTPYTVFNFREGMNCNLRACPLPLVASNLGLISSDRYIYRITINDCFSEPCVNGHCTDQESGYTCTCFAEYTGENCDTAITTTQLPTTGEADTTISHTTTDTTISHTTTDKESTTLDYSTSTSPETTVQETSTAYIETTTTVTHTTTTEPAPSTSGSSLTEEFLRQEDLIILLAETDLDIKKDLGYTLNDMMIDCTYDGRVCKESDFSYFFNAVHGSCYIFNSNWTDHETSLQVHAKQQGDYFGLKVILDIGQQEYIQDVGQSAGAVVVVHNSDQMPFPEDEGILALPGRLTNVAMRRVDVDRLPEPYGDCVQDIDRNHSRSLYEDLYPVKYSVSSCYRTCYQKYVVEACGCGDPQYPIEGQVFGGIEVIPCNTRNQTQDTCKMSITQMYINDDLGCDCPNPCKQTGYEYKVSSAEWPSQVSEGTMLSAITTKRLSSGGPEPTLTDLKRNALKIQVFYDTLSYEKLLEYPAYKVAKLFWDIGGILGLWLGCSVLSIVELLELFLDSLVLLCYKIKNSKQNVIECSLQQTSTVTISNLHDLDGTNSFDDKHGTLQKKFVISSRRLHKPWHSGDKIKQNQKSHRHENSEEQKQGYNDDEINKDRTHSHDINVLHYIFGNITSEKDNIL